MTDDGTTKVRAGRRTVEVKRVDKVLFPGDGRAKEYTKGDLVDYYRAVAAFMLPHLRGRPLMLERHPDGVDGPQFMQKNTPEHYPDWITRVEVTKEDGTVRHTVCDDVATLVFLADQACLTLHRWLSRTDDIGRPDRMVFDLDPAGDDFGQVREAAGLLGELLDELKLPSAPMTTGSRGLHIVVPLKGRRTSTRCASSPGTSPTPLPTPTRTGSPPPPARRTAATVSTSTYSATPTPRQQSRPTPCAPVPAHPWPHPDLVPPGRPGPRRPPLDHRGRRGTGPHQPMGGGDEPTPRPGTRAAQARRTPWLTQGD